MISINKTYRNADKDAVRLTCAVSQIDARFGEYVRVTLRSASLQTAV